jgi:tRNA (mo5U34)-methyltransferase
MILTAVQSFLSGDAGRAIDLFEMAHAKGSIAIHRVAYTLGLLLSAQGERQRGGELIRVAVSERPGILPMVPIHFLKGLNLGAELEANPTIRLARAESLMADGEESNARQIYIDIIRTLRGGKDFKQMPAGLGEGAVREQIAPNPIWHSIDLGGELFIEGCGKSARSHATELLRMHIPELSGKTVLDIGAWDGFYSLECERRGAAGVTALDYYSWITDFTKLSAWEAEERANARVPDPYHPPAGTVDLQCCPGRRALDVASGLVGSKMHRICSVFEEASAETLGSYDIVFYLGVLYHVKDPLAALSRVCSVCRELAIIETLGVVVPGAEARPIWEFYHDDSINQDLTTWWAPSEKGFRDMLLTAGFKRVDILYGTDSATPTPDHRPVSTRIFAHAYK